MTREQYESLPMNELKGVAKARGLKRISTLRKSELIDRMLREDAAEEEAVHASGQTGNETSSAPAEKETAFASAERETGSAHAEQEVTPAPAEQETGSALAEQETASVHAEQEKAPETRKYRRTSEGGNSARTRGKESGRHPGRSQDGRSQEGMRTRMNHTQNPNRSKQPRGQEGSAQNYQDQPAQKRPQQQEYSETQRPQRTDVQELDSGHEAHGILEVLTEGYGFIRSENFLPGDDDVYVSPSQIRKFGLKTGDMLSGNTRVKSANEKFSAMLYINSVNGMDPAQCQRRMHFEDMTPIFPNERIHLERPGGSLAMRIVDLISPIGKGQRGMIVSPPKAGKTTLLKDTAKSILRNNPEMHLIILLIDERPEEVTDIKETVQGDNVEVIYSTFDELPEHHRRVSEMVIERAKRLVENKKDVMIFIDSITRLARAYNQVVPPSGRTLSGGLDPAALHMPKRFFGAARNMREGGSLTILATALVDTGSKMDDVVYEEFKGTGNMELVLDRKLQERRVFPAIDIVRSGTRKEDLLLSKEELEAVNIMRRSLNRMKTDEAAENILDLFAHTRTNADLVRMINRRKMI
jgi:transcription termination factor Rho